MTISLLHIVVPTILILVVMILYINSVKKELLNEIGELKAQLEKADNVSDMTVAVKTSVMEKTERESAEFMPENVDEEKEVEDELTVETETVDASAYNIGKSGKIYTREELELLIKE